MTPAASRAARLHAAALRIIDDPDHPSHLELMAIVELEAATAQGGVIEAGDVDDCPPFGIPRPRARLFSVPLP